MPNLPIFYGPCHIPRLFQYPKFPLAAADCTIWRLKQINSVQIGLLRMIEGLKGEFGRDKWTLEIPSYIKQNITS